MDIHPATADDAPALLRLVNGLVADHLPGQQAWATIEDLRRDGFGPDPVFEALLAFHDGEAVGYVSFFRGYAGWRGRPMGFVHGLYVEPKARGHGVARRLMAEVARIAVARGWIRIELFVEEGRPAIGFYEAIGTLDLHHRHLRLEGETLTRLAASP